MKTAQRICVAFAVMAMTAVSYAQTPGMLDPSFDGTGYVLTQFPGSTHGHAVGLVISSSPSGSDPSYLVAGSTGPQGTNQRRFALAKYALDGSLLATATHEVAVNDVSEAMACAPGGSGSVVPNGLFVAGLRKTSTGTKYWHLAAFTTTLELATSFHDVGWVETSWDNSMTDLHAMAVQSDGKVLLTGYVGEHVGILRYTAVGQLDPSFSTDGKAIIDIPGMTNERANAIVVAESGSIFVAGYGSFGQGFIAKLTSNGNLDLSWGTDGVVTYSITVDTGTPGNPEFTSHSTVINALRIDENDNLLAAGRIKPQADSDDWGFFAARRNADGTPDNNFGTLGYTILQFPGPGAAIQDQANDLVIQPDGRIVLAGSSSGLGTDGLGANVALARLESNGSLDQSFGTGGTVETHINSAGDVARSVEISNERIIVTGWGRHIGLGLYDNFLTLRYLTGLYVGVLELTSPARDVLIYPNPIAENTTFTYMLAQSERLTIALHDMQGRLITTFLDGVVLPAGEHQQVVTMPADLAHGNYLLVFSGPQGHSTVKVSK